MNKFRELPLALSIRKFLLFTIPFFSNNAYKVAPPANLKKSDQHLFKNDFYYLSPLKVKRFKGVFVYLTQDTGIIFSGGKLVRECIHGDWSTRPRDPIKNYVREVTETYLAATYQPNGNLIKLNDDKIYLLIHHWFNYYHWLTESILRIWFVREDLSTYTLLLPECLKEYKYVTDSLKAFNIGVKWVPKGFHVTVRNLLLVENKLYNDHYFPEQTAAIGDFFRNHVKSLHLQVPAYKKIYISRKKAERRKIQNEAEVIRLLEEYGFKTICFEDYSFYEQVALMKNAEFLIGMHGAGLTNMLFMPQGGCVLEFHSKMNDSINHLSSIYWKLASTLRHQYLYQFCKTGVSSKDFFTANIWVDISLLEKNIKELGSIFYLTYSNQKS